MWHVAGLEVPPLAGLAGRRAWLGPLGKQATADMGKRSALRGRIVVEEVEAQAVERGGNGGPVKKKRVEPAGQGVCPPGEQEQAEPSQQPEPKATKKSKPSVPKAKPAWRQDSASCRACVSKDVPGKGRGLVATQRLQAGAEVASELPAVHWIYKEWQTSICACCANPADMGDARRALPLPCGDCGTVAYCSEVCRASDAKRHGVSCALLGSSAVQAAKLDTNGSSALSLVRPPSLFLVGCSISSRAPLFMRRPCVCVRRCAAR